MNCINKVIDNIITSKRGIFWFFFVVLILLTSFMVYSYTPLLPGHDFHFHQRRLQALMEAMANGNFFLIYLDHTAANGYGYFTKAFYPDIILVPFALIGNVTSIQFAYLSLIFVMTVLCGVFTYKMINDVHKSRHAALLGALLYTFCLYRLLDIYDRAAIGEAISFTFLPLVFLGLYHIIKGNYKKWYILAIGFSLMILTHLLSSVLTFITILIFLLIYNKSLREEPKRLGYLVLSAGITLLLSAYYLFPMFEQMLSNSFYYSVRDIMNKAEDTALGIHWVIWGMFGGIVHPKQLFIPGIGLILTIAITLRLFVYGKSSQLRSVDILAIVGLVYVFAASSLFPWGYFPLNLLNFIQLPFRLYEFSSLFFAVAGGYYMAMLLKNNKRFAVGTLFITALIFISIASFSTHFKEMRQDQVVVEKAIAGNNYHLGGLEYLPNNVPSVGYIDQRGGAVKSSDGAILNVQNFTKNKGVTSFDFTNNNVEVLELPLIYYKGYRATLNGADLSVSESINGLVQIDINSTGHIESYYAGTLVQKLSWFISLATVLFLVMYICNKKNKKEIIK